MQGSHHPRNAGQLLIRGLGLGTVVRTPDDQYLDEIYSTLRADNNKFRTESLFYEMGRKGATGLEPVFTLKERDHKGYLSIRRKYLEIADPTEYKFAQKMFRSWDHWKTLTNSKFFKPHLESMREELRSKLASDRYFEILETAQSSKGTATGVSASKWISEQFGEPEEKKSKRGRPSKQEIENERKRLAREAEDFSDDAERIGL